jgi:N6-adenosine-specific RNA methylase IME4
MTPLEPHEYAKIFPLIDDAAARSVLANDIREKGLIEPIILYEGKILDGRNRYRALCDLVEADEPLPLGEEWGTLAGKLLTADVIEPGRSLVIEVANQRGIRLYEDYGGDDPIARILSLNLHRRHLNESQRAMIGARLATMRQGERTDVEPSANLQKVSRAKAAQQVNVSERSVNSAKTVLDKAAPEIIVAVDHGKLSVDAATKAAVLPQETQRKIAEAAEADNPNAARTIIKREARNKREQKIGAHQARELPFAPEFGVILADPPWRYETWSENGMLKAAENHYPTMTTNEICALPVETIAATHALLLLWATPPMMPDALEVMDAWGFTYRSHMVWQKDVVGTGHWFRMEHELLLVGTRGRPPAPAQGEQWTSVRVAPRAAHSEKPVFAHTFAETFWPSFPKIELFARQPRLGWMGWGNQLERPPGEPEAATGAA